MFILQHCKPAVDEDTFLKMVDRQYEIMKRERTRQLEESASSSIKPPLAPADNEAPPAPSQPCLPPPTSAPAPSSDSSNSQEVSLDFFAIT